jgi:hypothetical protein
MLKRFGCRIVSGDLWRKSFLWDFHVEPGTNCFEKNSKIYEERLFVYIFLKKVMVYKSNQFNNTDFIKEKL